MDDGSGITTVGHLWIQTRWSFREDKHVVPAQVGGILCSGFDLDRSGVVSFVDFASASIFFLMVF